MSTKPSTPSTISSSHDTRLVSEDAHAAGAAVKDVRAREHARQRIKTRERRELALARERKEKAAAVRALGLKGTTTATHGHGAGHGGAGNAGKLVRRLSMESWDGEVPRETKEVRDAVRVESEQAPEPKTQDGADASGFTALTLGDVISRPRRSKARPLDFEVIPPIRTVIALDDADADEPWEYITRASLHDGSASWKGKSYAQAVASAM